ncbi:MAG: GNAT family N-acetyltransferase [Candidatus Odinarchaeota archaeon]
MNVLYSHSKPAGSKKLKKEIAGSLKLLYMLFPRKTNPRASFESRWKSFHNILTVNGVFMNAINAITIERAREEDAAVLATVCKEAFHTDVDVGAPGSGEPGGPPDYDSPDFQKFIMSVLTYYKILIGDKIVGGVFFDHGNAEHYILERIFVSPAYHNRGIATQAMELVHKNHPEAKIWTLGTPKWNIRTRHFYEKLGYVQVGWEEEESPDWWGIWYQKNVKPYTFPKISDLKDGMRAISVEGKIASILPAREVESEKGREKTIVAGAKLVDDSGKIILELRGHHVQVVRENKAVRIENGQVSTQEGELLLKVPYGRIITLL